MSAEATISSDGAEVSGFALEQMFWGVALFGLALLVFIPAFNGGFLWGDDQTIAANGQVQSLNGWWTLWLQPQTANYFPLSSTSFWLDWHFWKFDAGPYHVVNALLHGVVAVLTWQTLKRLLIPGAWVAAAIFAVHPVCVGTVAWISGRENILSQIFLLLTVIAYTRFRENEGLQDYILAFVCFTLSLLAETSGVMLPFILMLLGWWRSPQFDFRRELTRMLPFILAAFVLGLVTVHFQWTRAIGAEQIPMGNWWQRMVSAGFATGFYLYSALCPFHVMAVYPEWHRAFSEVIQKPYVHLLEPSPDSLPYWLQAVPGILMIALLVFCWLRRAEAWARAVFVALGCHILALLPVLGFVTMSYFRITLVSDSFQYISLIAVLALPVAAGARVVSRATSPVPKVVSGCLVGALVCLFSVISWRQAATYLDEETFWSAVLPENPNTWQGHNHLGAALYMQGDVKDALPHFLRATELNPANPESHNNLGLAYAYFGEMDKAIEQYKMAVQIKDDPSMETNLANAYEQKKDYRDAINTYHHAIALSAGNASAHCNLGYALMQTGHISEAIGEFVAAIQIDPTMVQARMDLAEALKMEGIDYTAPVPSKRYPFDAALAVRLLKQFPPPPAQ